MHLKFIEIHIHCICFNIAIMLNRTETTVLQELIPPKLKSSYTNIMFISQTINYVVFEAKSASTNQIHNIRALDINNQFVRDNYNSSATLFIQELIRLCIIQAHPGTSIPIETFEICGNKMAFSSLPYNNLESEIGSMSSKLHKTPNTHLDIEKLIADVLIELEFLQEHMKLPNCNKLVTPQHIYRFKDSGSFFLADWVCLANQDQEASHPQSYFEKPESFQSNCMVLGDFAEEIYELGLVILELSGMKHESIENLRVMKQVDSLLYDGVLENILAKDLKQSTSVKNLLGKMLKKKPVQRAKFKELLVEVSTINEQKMIETSHQRATVGLDQRSIHQIRYYYFTFHNFFQKSKEEPCNVGGLVLR